MGRGTVVAPLTSRGRPALCGRVSNNAYQNRAFEMGKIAASASFTPGKMLPVAVTAAAVASNRRRSMFNGKIRSRHDALLRTKGWRYPLGFAVVVGHIPVSGRTTVLAEAGWSRAPALVLMRAGGWNREKEGVKPPPLSTEGQITEESAPPGGPGRGFARP